MKQFLKYVLWALAGLIALLMSVIAYVAATFDPNAYKQRAIQSVQESLHRTLKLDGDIKLHVFPSLGVSVDKVALSEYQSEQEFASVEHASVSLKLFPLLTRQLVVDEVAVSGVKARLIKYKDGKTNIDDFGSKEASQPPAQSQTAETSSSPMTFDIAAIKLDKTELSYRDEATGASYAVKDATFQSGRLASNVPTPLQFSLHAQGNQPKLDMTIQAKATLAMDLPQGFFQLQGLDLQANGQVLDISGLSLKANGDASARTADKTFALNRFALTVSGTKVKDAFEVKLDAPEVNLTKEKFSANRIALNAKLDGAAGNLTAALAVPGIDGSATSFKVSELTLDAGFSQPAQSFKLRLTTPLTGSIESQQFNLSNLKLAVDASGDKLPGKNIHSELKGGIRADFGRQNIEANLDGGLLQSQIKAKLAVNNFANPAIRYDFEVDQFDADPFMPKKAEGAKEAVPDKTAPEQPFDLSPLKKLNVEGSVRIGSLKAANIKVGQLRVDVKAKSGLVSVFPISAKLYQGSLDGKATINAQTNDFSFSEKMAGVDIAPLTKDVANLDVAEGKGNIVVDVTTQGNTVRALKKGLNGKASIELANGAIKGINLEKLVQGLQSLNKETKTQALGVDKSEKTPFSEFKASFKIKNGVAHNDDLAVKSSVLRITGKGDVDIGNDRMNYNTKVIFARSEQGKTATLPVGIEGPFDSLKFNVDYSALLVDVARQKLDDKKDELKAKAQDELKNKLKGLFK